MATIPEALAMAVQYHLSGNLQQAEAIYRQILQVDPSNADALHLLGVIAHQAGESNQAIRYITQAIGICPSNVAFHNNLGEVYRAQGQLAAAVAQYQEAIRLEPDHAEAYLNLGNALKDQGQLAAAVAHYQEAIRLKPDFVEPHNNLGNALKDQGQLPAAVAHYQEAIRLKPDFADAHFNRALARLLAGDFKQGWAEYEWLWRRKDFASLKRSFCQPHWDGSSLTGMNILLHAEHGLGDTIQFIRYAPLVKNKGAIVIVECQPTLLELLQSCVGVDRAVARGASLPPFDVHASLLSLPGILGTTLETIPVSVPYLFADAALVERWRQELTRGVGSGEWGVGSGTKRISTELALRTPITPPLSPPNSPLPSPLSPRFRIGIVWQGSPKHKARSTAFLPPGALCPVGPVAGSLPVQPAKRNRCGTAGR